MVIFMDENNCILDNYIAEILQAIHTLLADAQKAAYIGRARCVPNISHFKGDSYADSLCTVQ